MSAREIIVRVLNDEGARPGSSLHSWRCEHPDRYGVCDCVEQVADEILLALSEAVDPQCCDAGRVAYPDPCPWHPKPGDPEVEA